MATNMSEAELAQAFKVMNATKAQAAAEKKKALTQEASVAGTSQSSPKIAPVKASPGNKYSDIDGMSTGKLASAKWKDEDLGTVAVYRIPPVTSAKCIALGQRLLGDIQGNTISSSSADICLVLALSLPKPASQAYEHLLTPIPATVGHDTLFTMPEANDAPVGLSEAQKRSLQSLRDKLTAAESPNAQEGLRNRIRRLEEQEAGGVSTAVAVVNESDASAYCFLAAFMMKLGGKSEESFLDSIQQMKIRYPAWYEGTSNVLTNFAPSIDNIKSFRAVFNRRPELLSTWIMTIAHNENQTLPLSTTQQGLLNYLACQQFAYTGMHAYTLLLAIHEATGIKLGSLLKEMDCPITRTGIKAAYEIIKDHEITSRHPNRKTYFRYARVWNPKYFSALQSSNCTTLVYVAAKVAKITAPQKAGGDPMGIFAIKDLDPAMTARLNTVATKMSEFILNTMLVDQDSGNAWR